MLPQEVLNQLEELKGTIKSDNENTERYMFGGHSMYDLVGAEIEFCHTQIEQIAQKELTKLEHWFNICLSIFNKVEDLETIYLNGFKDAKKKPSSDQKKIAIVNLFCGYSYKEEKNEQGEIETVKYPNVGKKNSQTIYSICQLLNANKELINKIDISKFQYIASVSDVLKCDLAILRQAIDKFFEANKEAKPTLYKSNSFEAIVKAIEENKKEEAKKKQEAKKAKAKAEKEKAEKEEETKKKQEIEKTFILRFLDVLDYDTQYTKQDLIEILETEFCD